MRVRTVLTVCTLTAATAVVAPSALAAPTQAGAGVTGGSAGVVSTDAATAATPEAPRLGGPAADVVAAARQAPFVRYARGLPGGAYTNAGNSGGAAITLAFAALAGDRSADTRLLQQMRYTLTGGNDIAANGGYPAQHELQVTGMFATAKLVPRVWNRLRPAERARVDTLMKASLVASAFTTSDQNPFVLAGGQQYTLDGDSNVNRDWNPNYREGMGGSILVATAYFGVERATEILRTYDHDAFVERLAADGLTNAHGTFTWKATHPDSAAPTGAQIESAVHDWSLHGITLDQTMDMSAQLSEYTYGGTVECGLNGTGILMPDGTYAGVIDSGCEGLPNLGRPGMLLEFTSVDAEGQRSSADYAYGGYKPNLITQAVLIANGMWEPGPTADRIVSLMSVGVTDLWYKLDHGYRGYSHARFSGILRSDDPDFGFVYLRSLWNDVVRPYHRIQQPS